jgi:putative permease
MAKKSSMFQVVSNWFRRNFSDPEALGLFFFLLIMILLLEFFGNILMPVIISIVIAYLLNSVVKWLEHLHFPRWLAFSVVYLFFISLLVVFVIVLLPLLWKQMSNLLAELPKSFAKAQTWLTHIMQLYPKLFTGDPLTHITGFLKEQTVKIGQSALTYSLSSIPGIIETVIYFVLVPLLVFFFLKDGRSIADWFARYLPTNRGLIRTVWMEVNNKIAAYVRGRVMEVIIVALASMISFGLLGMQYAFLIGALVGVSVIVPYLGAIIVTVPVVIIALMQWGFNAHFGYVIITYGVIIALDANVLFPLLFSETMDLHPIVIILSVLVFGGIWGFWGVFFAIPLATLVNAVLNAWPQVRLPEDREGASVSNS